MSKQEIGGSVINRLGRRARVATIGMLAAATMALTACSGGGGIITSSDADSLDAGLTESVGAAVESAMQQSGSTAAIVGVWTEGGELVRAYGDQDIDSSSLIRGAQATQPVMCALLLDLAADGTVPLNRKVSEDLTRQVGIEGVTYAQLCNGTSGLADFKKHFNDIFVNNPTRPWSDRELLAESLVRSPLSWPGLDFHQADTNTMLLARAIEIKTAIPIEHLLKDRVFGPAGMSASYFPSGESLSLKKNSMTGLTYPSAGGAPVCDVEAPNTIDSVSPSMLSGAGATVTTVTDLKNFYEHFLDGSFGGAEFGKLPTEVTPTKNPERDENGDAVEELPEPEPGTRMWAFGAEKVGPLYGRAGSMTGTLTAAYHDPESGYSVVVALNNSSAGAEFAKDLALEIAAISAEQGQAPEMPWTAEARATSLAERAVCQPAE